MTNADVVKMVKAGLSEPVIAAAIRKAPRRDFRTDADSLVALKAGGVSDGLVAVMLDPEGKPAPPAAPARSEGPAAAAPARPAEREAGIYADMGAASLVPLEPTTFSQAKSGGFFMSAITYGIKKAKWKAVVRSPASNFRILEPRPRSTSASSRRALASARPEPSAGGCPGPRARTSSCWPG